jgi:hypothetical protein
MDCGPNRQQANLVTILARLNKEHSAFMDFYVFPRITKQGRFRIGVHNSWLKSGVRLRDHSRFCDVVTSVADARAMPAGNTKQTTE